MIKTIGKYFYRKKGHFPVRINGHKFKGDPFHIGFWRIVNRNGFEPVFFKILDKYLDNNSVYCDIGSWIGPTVMYVSGLCKKVYAFEPDKVAYPYLLQNIELNKLKNIEPQNIAISQIDGDVNMASHGGHLGDSMSSMVNIEGLPDIVTVPSLKWQSWLDKYNPAKIDFIKIDIEGGEVNLIPDMIDYLKTEKPILHLSIHGPYLAENSRREQLKNLLKSLRFYKQVFDDDLQPVSINDDLITKCEAGFVSLLFLVKK